MSERTAREYIELTRLWEATGKDIVIDNIERLVGYLKRGNRNSEVINRLMLMTESNRHSVFSWTNRSRENVKIPLLKLCQIADNLDVDVFKFFDVIKVERKWENNPNITERQKALFSQIEESNFFKNGEWDIPYFVSYMDGLENYSDWDSKKNILEKDCTTYFKEILDISSGKFLSGIVEYIKNYMEEKT